MKRKAAMKVKTQVWQTRHLKHELLQRARALHHRVLPCGHCSGLDDGFVALGDDLTFWFNTVDKSTHMVKAQMQGAGGR